MKNHNTSFTFHPVAILFIGLLMSHTIAFFQVYLSNLDLYTAVSAVKAAGYLAIPNEKVMPVLREFRPAFWGGLFYTFTIGAAVSLVSMAAAWFWIRTFQRNTSGLILFAAAWTGFLIWVNTGGFTLMPTLYFLLIPPVLFLLTTKRVSRTDSPSNAVLRWAPLIPVPLLAILWSTQYDDAMFIDLRDNLLLTNTMGQKFSDFYYTYTLYPAEAFKSLDQKSIKTYRLVGFSDGAGHRKVARAMLAGGYLPLPDGDPADLTVVRGKDYFFFETSKKLIFKIKMNEFLSDPAAALRRYSLATDRHAVFRQFTFLSILMGFPVLIYIVLYAVFYFLCNVFLNRRTALPAASAVCLFIGVIVLVLFQANRSGSLQIEDVAEALKAKDVYKRIAALKIIEQKKMEITDYRQYPLLLKSPVPLERYWFVRTLAVSSRPATFSDLLAFINDENINVRSMAFYALGRRGNRRAIRPIKEKIKVSRDWYTQMYAYEALRTLGWMQKKSP
jgi:hypothetical protein